MLSDSHCHLGSVKPELVSGLIEQAKANDVGISVSMGENLDSSRASIRIAQGHEGVFAGLGIHPWHAVLPTPEIRSELEALSREKKVVIIGEIGLDYARHPETRETQKELFRYLLGFARGLDLAVDVHSREAHEDMMAILGKEVALGLKGIAHGFSGDTPALRDWLGLDFYISIGVRGFVLNEIPSLVAAVKEIPENRLLSETDMATTGGLTGPAAVGAVVQKLALVRGTSPGEMAMATTANLKRVLRI